MSDTTQAAIWGGLYGCLFGSFAAFGPDVVSGAVLAATGVAGVLAATVAVVVWVATVADRDRRDQQSINQRKESEMTFKMINGVIDIAEWGDEICPRCDVAPLRIPLAANALSRTTRQPEDVAVYVCSDCGTSEAFQEFYGNPQQATPQDEWPVSNGLRGSGGAAS
jgi:RNase P subunit RPR2